MTRDPVAARRHPPIERRRDADAGPPAPGTPTLAETISRPGLHTVLLGGSRDPNAKVTLVLIDRYGPAFFIKVAATSTAAQAVRREGELLAGLHRGGLGRLGLTLPRPIGYVDADGMPGLVATALPGRPMSVAYHSWRHTARRRLVTRDFQAAGRWLRRLQNHTAAPKRPIDLLTTSLDRIEMRFGPQTDLRDRLRGAEQRLAAQRTPRSAVHGDYWFGNLLVARGDVVGVVDWESGQRCGQPLRDVARFAVSYSLYLDRHVAPGASVPGHRGLRATGWGAGLAYAVTGDGWYPDVVRQFCALALENLGADPACGPDVLLAGIADVAATADHAEFALAHLNLLRNVTSAS